MLLLRTLVLVITTLAMSVGGSLAADAPAPPAAPAASATPAAPAEEAITAIPLAEMAAQAELTEAKRQKIEAELASDDLTSQIKQTLPGQETDVTKHVGETQKAISSSPSFDTLPLPDLENYWKQLQSTLTLWKAHLTARAQTVQTGVDQLNAEIRFWDETKTGAAKGAANLPSETKNRIDKLKGDLADSKKKATSQINLILKLQSQVVAQDTKATAMLSAVRHERVKGLFFKDKLPLWDAAAYTPAAVPIPASTSAAPSSLTTTLATHWDRLQTYVQRQSDPFIFNLLLFTLLCGALMQLRRTARNHEGLEPIRPLLAKPIAAALVLSLMVLELTYPQPPPLFWTLWTMLALGGAAYLLRNLLGVIYRPLMTAIFGMLLLDEVREVLIADPIHLRLILLAETLLGAAFTLWFWRFSPFARVPAAEKNVRWRTTRAAVGIVFGLFAAATLANLLGYVRPADFLCNAVAESTNHAVVLYSLVCVGDGYLFALLTIGPFSRLHSVSHHRGLLWQRSKLFLRWGMAAVVILVTLQMLGMRHIVWGWADAVLATKLTFASDKMKVGDLFHFVLTLASAFYLSRLIRFLLSEEIYPRVNLPRGIPYAISTMIHYAILLFAFFAAVGDMSKFSILAGAFGVGLGFGLQNIFNNFVSGLILLFERPVKIGDVVQIGTDTGSVQRIGIRASVICTEAGAELIIPNGKLISDTVTNWTFSNRQRGFVIALTVPRQTEPGCMIDLMVKAATDHPKVLRYPAPEALLTKLNATTFDFELRAWTNDVERWLQIRSEITVALDAALVQACILAPPAEKV